MSSQFSLSSPGGEPELRTLVPETRSFPPSAEFARNANVTAEWLADQPAEPDEFWAKQAARLDWHTPWHTTHVWEPTTRGADGELSIPHTEWFSGGRLNVAVNCVDRHVAAGRGDKIALYFEGEPGDRRAISYAELQDEVSRAANVLSELGIGRGDRVVIYLPVIPETIIATLAVARLGAIHSLVFGGFSAEALRFRVADTGAKLLITTDGQFRRGAAVAVKNNADLAVAESTTIEHVLVIRRTESAVSWTEGRDVWWHERMAAVSPRHEPEFFDAENPLFIIYTSGTTGKPKGLVHTSGGYLTQAAFSHWAIFDARQDDVHWCTADLAWVTAHTYEIYGPLVNGLTQVIYEGTPDTPHPARHFEIIERYGVTTYYTAPTLIRTLATRFPDGPPEGYDLSSLRLLGTVGEAINPEAWIWFHGKLGRGSLPIVDTWWQSETGAAILAPLPGLATLKPGSATRALPGVAVAIVDEHGVTVPYGSGGYLVVDRPGPALARTVWGDPERYRDSYWTRFAERGAFFSGDGAKWDAEGDIWVLGRVDDVVNVSGHRLSTIEIESVLVAHPEVAEAGVVGVSDAVTGQAIIAYVVGSGEEHDGALDHRLEQHIRTQIGAIARPRAIIRVPDLPKTRSGKIMRRLLVDLYENRALGDVTSLQDDTVPEKIEALLRPGA